MDEDNFLQASVVQTLDSAIHRIEHYPADKYKRNELLYPMDGDLSNEQSYLPFEQLGRDRQEEYKVLCFSQ